ncbi:hypothetical protein RKE38_03865 [Phycicoccus sp. M110.8]|uniref:hypothetical protein n=1 Tax=Phycicoccus sp. M110.8 TaxID=3075433 RepID=UPI0028FD210D|nr:hypothetical protein [Phycicoccus sp. M110.8]MDU0312811.1 hypothetical protein [Phycicoccus sp. M110.8]
MTDERGAALRTAVSAMGVVVGIEVTGARAAEVLARVPELWAHCRADDEAEPETVVPVHFDGRDDAPGGKADDDAVGNPDNTEGEDADARGPVRHRTEPVTAPDLEDLLQLLTQRITVAAIDALEGRHLMLHAACLADPTTGRAAVFVAPGGTGKTTLVRTLGPGRWYVTDETAVIRSDGSIEPYPKPLSVRRKPGSAWKNETAPGGAGLVPPAGPVHIVALSILRRDDAHSGAPAVTTLGTLDAVVELTHHASHLPSLDRPLQRVAALVESLGGVHSVTYRESADLAELVDGWLAVPR